MKPIRGSYSCNKAAPSTSLSFRASVGYIVFGRRDSFEQELDLATLDGSNGFSVSRMDQGYSSISASGAGDINGDGFDDLIFGTSFDIFSIESGESFIVFGSDDPFEDSLNLLALDGSDGFRIGGSDINLSLGVSVSSAGDVNNDRIDDVIIGAPFAAANGIQLSGETFVVFGQTHGFQPFFDLSTLNGRNGFKLNGTVLGDQSGIWVSAAGDVNGDGIDDLIIGAPFADVSDRQVNAGASYLVYGRNGDFRPTLNLSDLDGENGIIINGIDPGDNAGVVSGAGDLNGDGVNDLIIGASEADPEDSNGAGESYVIFGQQQNRPERNRIIGAREAERLVGNNSDNVIVGKLGNDTLIGLAGNDRLLGGQGMDILYGGAGVDKFVLQNIRHGADHILDFKVSEDRILIRQAGFDLDVDKGVLANSRFVLGSSAQDRSDRFIYDNRTGALLFDPDGTRNQRAVLIAYLHSNQELSAANIRIV